MIVVVIEVEAPVHARGVVLVTARAFAVLAGLIRGASKPTAAAVGLVVLQIHAILAACIEATDTFSSVADLTDAAGLIAVPTMGHVFLWIDASLTADQQRDAASLHAFPIETKLVTTVIAAATVLRVGLGVHANVVTHLLRHRTCEITVARHTGLLVGTRVVAPTAVFRRALEVDADRVADLVGLDAITFARPVHAKLVVVTSDTTRAAMIDATADVDANIVTEFLGAPALGDADTVFADFIIET